MPRGKLPAQPENYIADWLAYFGVTQTELAKAINADKSQISKLVHGGLRFDTVWMRRIADGLKLAVGDLTQPPPGPPGAGYSGPLSSKKASQSLDTTTAGDSPIDVATHRVRERELSRDEEMLLRQYRAATADAQERLLKAAFDAEKEPDSLRKRAPA